MPPEKLIEVKLRLSEGERRAIEELRGDRGLNVCLRRAVQHWCIRERALQESVTLGLYADGLPPTQSAVTQIRPATVTPINRTVHVQSEVRTHTPQAEAPPSEVPTEDDETDEVEEQEPARRRPPTSAETWGAGPDHAS